MNKPATTPVIGLDEIKRLIDVHTLIQNIETGFVRYSEGQTEVPPVGFLHFDSPPGDVHIKYGYIHGDDYYVLKVASAFTDNKESGQPVNNGMVLVFSSQTGAIAYILLDEGWLTDIRTAAAGAVAAKYLSSPKVDTIGIVGTGTQARLQLELLRDIIDCKRCVIWGRNSNNARKMVDDLHKNPLIKDWGITISVVDTLESLAQQSRLIVTTTPSKTPLLLAEHIQPGTHITAMGSDDHGKQELHSSLLAKADVVVADSKSQCIDHGECYTAIQHQKIQSDDIIELGDVISRTAAGRTEEQQITIADLTGVAVQDIQAATMVANACKATHT